jgi:hypothetical protein
MSWIGPVAKNAAKYGAKYGPHAKVAWEAGGKHLQAAARAKLDEIALRRKAFDQAEGLREGSVLRVVERGQAVFVVFSGDDPVGSYPPVQQPLDELVAHADLSKRRTAEQFHEQQLRARARRGAAKARNVRRQRT